MEDRRAGVDVPPFRSVVFGGGLVVLMVASAFMQYTLGVLGPVLIERFDISRTRLGLLTSVLFLVGSAGSPVAGRLIDRLGARRLVAFPFLATISGFLLLAGAPTYALVVTAVAVAGTGMAFANPLSNKLIALHVPAGKQGLLMGIKQSGVQLAATLAGIVMPTAVVLGGLRGASAGAAVVLGAGLLVALLSIPQDPDAPRAGVRTSAPATVPAAGSTTVGQPDDSARAGRVTLLWISVYAFLMGSGIASVYAYLPLFAVDVLGMSVGRAGLLASLIGIMGMASRIIWGAISERLRHPSTALVMLAITAVVAQGLLWSSPVAGSWAVWVAVLIMGASAVAWNAVAMFTVVRVLGTSAAGANSGVIQLAFFSGFAAGPIGFGLLTDATGGYGIGWAAVTTSFALAAAVAGRWALLTRRVRAAQPSR
jgi:predicted MFS family arabinose efflux permease